MNDNQFIGHFETVTLPHFDHRDHVRVAWIYLRREGWEQGYRAIQEGIKHYANTLGASGKYHETITRFWAELVQHCIDQAPTITDFDTFVETYPILLESGALLKHYSPEVVFSPEARAEYIAPDLIAMP